MFSYLCSQNINHIIEAGVAPALAQCFDAGSTPARPRAAPSALGGRGVNRYISMCVYIYIYIYVVMCMCMYIYIYIYIYIHIVILICSNKFHPYIGRGDDTSR